MASTWLRSVARCGAILSLFLLYTSYGMPSGPGDLHLGRLFRVSISREILIRAVIESHYAMDNELGSSKGRVPIEVSSLSDLYNVL